MQAVARTSRSFGLVLSSLATLVLASAGGCTLHRNLLLRWHLEFDADSICDDEVPCSTDDGCRCDQCSKLGRPPREPVKGPTPAQSGHARFHPLPTKPVFPEPGGADMADMDPPAPEWYLHQHEPRKERGRIESEQAVPAPDLEEAPPPTRPLSNSGWDVKSG